MLTSKELLLKEARAKGYKPEILEKVYRLLDTFQQFMSVPYLRERLVLKGGTALNLFCFREVPRLSVDIDVNYIGHLDRGKMLEDRLTLTQAIQKILEQNQYERHRSPSHHAGGKMVWFYNSLLGQRGSIEIDVNFMYRQTLFPPVLKAVNIPGYSDWRAPVLDIHELAAGKLSALFDRRVSRDLFDAHYLLKNGLFNSTLLRLAFVVYLAMTKIDLENLTVKILEYDLIDLRNRLLPVLQQKNLPRSLPLLKAWAEDLLGELKEMLSVILPLKKEENDFIDQIRVAGKIRPELITNDLDLAKKIEIQPALIWATHMAGVE